MRAGILILVFDLLPLLFEELRQDIDHALVLKPEAEREGREQHVRGRQLFLVFTVRQRSSGSPFSRMTMRTIAGHVLKYPGTRESGIHRSAAGLEDDKRLADMRSPRLVLTSSPYPGVHVLYHRWQVDGRKEAPLPFMIANKLDDAGSSYYRMGDRKYPELRTYFENIKATMSSVAALASTRTVIVQMVAFSEPKWQLPRYLETMEKAGLTELCLPVLHGEHDGRLWRSVPPAVV